jgi:hypothetical protein
MIMRDILGQQIDFSLLDKQIEKIRKQINDTYKSELIDVGNELSEESLLWSSQIQEEHKKVFNEMREFVEKEGLRLLDDCNGY